MAPTDILHAAKTLAGILGVASSQADPDLCAALSMAAIWRHLQADPADRLSDYLARLAVPTQIRLLIPRMIVEGDLTPAQIMAAGTPEGICALMLAGLTDPAHKSPKARDGFARLVTAHLTDHTADPAVAAAIAAALAQTAAQADALAARARPTAGVPEPLMAALARRHASADDTALTAALETAARLNAHTDMVVAALASLNATGQIAQADAAIAVILDQPGGTDTERALLHSLGVDQAHLLNAPDLAARRILTDLTRRPQASGLFRALHDAWEHWFDRGNATGAAYDLTVALHLARVNLDRSKGVQRRQALGDLGITQYRLGEALRSATHLTQSLATWRAFLTEHPRKTDPAAWATGQVNIAVALTQLATHTPDPALLDQAIAAFRAALQVQTDATTQDLLTAAEQQRAAL